MIPEKSGRGSNNSEQKAIKEAINYLLKTDFSKMENGKHPIKGEEMFALISEYETLPKEEKDPESHIKFIDIHRMINGEENIGVSSKGRKKGKYNADKDFLAYDSVEDEEFIMIRQGTFAIFFPNDIHRPGVAIGENKKVRKCVVKISVGLP
ncbi:MAG: YhcH/YjgK/YiaL family protein [Candidatus Micrarchaeota archaeon]